MVDFAAAGLGVQYGTVRLVRSQDGWTDIALALAADIEVVLVNVASSVEHIGSTAVPGLLAKPIIDLAIGLRTNATLAEVAEPLSTLGWIYRGDAGEDGGLVFVMEDSPWHRVAHVHGVVFGGSQWTRYVRFRDLLRGDASARLAYEEAKQRLAEQYPDGRKLYTAGKDATVTSLLASNAEHG